MLDGPVHKRWAVDILLQLHGRSTKEVPLGKNVELRFEFEKTGQEKFGAGGIGWLYINDEKVGESQISRTVKFMYANYEGFGIGNRRIQTGHTIHRQN